MKIFFSPLFTSVDGRRAVSLEYETIFRHHLITVEQLRNISYFGDEKCVLYFKNQSSHLWILSYVKIASAQLRLNSIKPNVMRLRQCHEMISSQIKAKLWKKQQCNMSGYTMNPREVLLPSCKCPNVGCVNAVRYFKVVIKASARILHVTCCRSLS